MKRHVLIATVLALLLPSLAQADDDFSRSGIYLGVNALFATHLFENDIRDELAHVDPLIEVSDTAGFSLRVGQRWFSWLASEVQYEYVDSFDVRALNTKIFDIQPNVLTINAKLVLPTWRVQPYALIGAGVAFYKLEAQFGTTVGPGGSSGLDVNFGRDEAAFAARFGGGLDIYLTKHFVLNAEATVLVSTLDVTNPTSTASLSALHYLSVGAGLQYRF